ncbi:APC family permease [Rubneribacter sp.]
MAKQKKFRMIDAILTVICVVFVAEAAAPAAAIGNPQFFWWIFLIITFLLPYGLIVCELGTTYADDAGGIADWVRRAFGDKWGSRVSWYYWINFPLWMASLAFLFPETIALLSGVELGVGAQVAIELAFVWIVVLMSFSKVSDSAWILNGGAVLKVLIAVAVGGLGIYHAMTSGFAGDMSPATFLPSFDASALTYLSIILFNFMGFEAIAVFAGDMENPKRQIPTAIIAGGLTIAAIYLFSSFGIGAAIPASEISLDSGIMDAVAIMAGNGSLLFVIIAVVFLITLFSNMISWSFGVNYVAAHSAEKANLPRAFARMSKNGVPTGAAVINGVIASVLVLVSPVMSAVGLDGFFWIFFSMNIVFLLICYIPMFPAFLKLREVDPGAKRIFRVPGGKAFATVAAWVPVAMLVLAMIATVVPLNGSEEELSKIPMLVGVVVFAVVGEVVRVVSARRRTAEYRGMADDGDPEAWDAARGLAAREVEGTQAVS